MNKKLIACGLLAAMMLSGCGAQGKSEANSQDTAVSHTHEAAEAYSWNGIEHWRECICGEKMDIAAHNVGEEDMCCVDCGLEVWDLGDGYVDVRSFDQQGNVLKEISYDPDGGISSEYIYEYEYDDQENVIALQFYVDGELQNRDEFVLSEDGENRIVNSTVYYSGERQYMEYDTEGNITYSVHYDANGEVTQESWSEYDCDTNGDSYEAKITTVDEAGEKTYAEYNRHGDAMLFQIYDADGNLTFENAWKYGYDGEHNMMWMMEYEDGYLVREITEFAVVTDEDDMTTRYPETVIEYYEDGSKLVTFNGTNTHPETETMYNSDGSVSHVRRYDYETFDNGNWKRIRVYQNDALLFDTEYVMDAENIWSRKAAMTEYLDDGIKIVFEYDENEEVISQRQYDAYGTEILIPGA